MTSIEETGKNIEEATQRALEQLGVTEDEVDVEILEEGARGFLGIGQAPARVRVTLREVRREEPRQQRPRRQPRPRPERRPEPAPAREVKPKEKPVAEAPVPTPAPSTPAPAPVIEEKKAPAPAAPAAEEVVLTPEILADAAEFGRDLLQRILDALGNGGAAAISSASDGLIVLDITGGDAPRIIGKHGQTINAMQYLVGIALNRKYHGRLRTTIDVEGYRDRREDALRKQALYLAKQVKENGQEAVLDALDANDRRIIHTALANDPDVYTYSEGEDPERHLVISPKK
jgi:spoIIIJ-associated protein